MSYKTGGSEWQRGKQTLGSDLLAHAVNPPHNEPFTAENIHIVSFDKWHNSQDDPKQNLV